MLRRFINANIAACDWIEDRLPKRFTRSLHALHERATNRLMNASPGGVVMDVGGGHLCPFAAGRDPSMGIRIIAVDISETQLRRNQAVDWKVAGDACRPLPLRDGAVDLVVTRSVLEHLPDNEAFVAETARVTRPGGAGVHVFPARFAPFAVINQLVPDRVARAVLHFVFPHWKSECGFPAHYHRCTADEMTAQMRRHGMEIEEIHLRYYQSIYFKFLLPLYLVSLAYDLAVWACDLRLLACQVLLVVRKPALDHPPQHG
jgi:ubiquinone/menaquinone biosynthesis C-methylase UbiE